jgi:hypothetical protein
MLEVVVVILILGVLDGDLTLGVLDGMLTREELVGIAVTTVYTVDILTVHTPGLVVGVHAHIEAFRGNSM